ncbi:hypothetical protein YC2023_103475 [Brassica napus]
MNKRCDKLILGAVIKKIWYHKTKSINASIPKGKLCRLWRKRVTRDLQHGAGRTIEHESHMTAWSGTVRRFIDICPDLVKIFDPQTYADLKRDKDGTKQAANGIRNLIGLLFVPRYFSEKSTTFPYKRRKTDSVDGLQLNSHTLAEDKLLPPKKKIRCGKIDGGKCQLSLKVEEAC